MIDEIILHDKTGKIVLQPVIEVLIMSSAPRAVLRDGIIKMYQEFDRSYGQDLKWYKTNEMKKSRKMRYAGLEYLQSMLFDKKTQDTYLLGVELSTKSDVFYNAPFFEFFTQEDLSDPNEIVKNTYIRTCLPVDIADRPEEAIQFVSDFLPEIDFDGGYCGYSYLWDGEPLVERELEKVNRFWLFRFPGLSFGDPLTFMVFAEDGIPGVNWLTFLGARQIERLGGEKVVRESLPEEVDVATFNNGALMIRAGEKPELGDVNRNNKLPLYGKVGNAFKSLRISDERLSYMKIAGLSSEDVRDWYNRFFEA
jgi:hypothetical protein